MIVSVTEVQILTALRNFLLSILPAGIVVTRGLTNRVPEPAGTDFCVMTPILRERLEWNTDTYGQDIETLMFAALGYTPSIGDVLTNSTLTAAGTVTNVNGTSITISPAIAPSAYFAPGDVVSDGVNTLGIVSTVTYGTKTVLTPTKVTIQVDVHGPNSGDNAALISSLMFDPYATDQFASSGFDVAPLYATEPKQIPFDNAEQQIEQRYVVDVVLQANPTVLIPVQYASAFGVNIEFIEQNYMLDTSGNEFVLDQSQVG